MFAILAILACLTAVFLLTLAWLSGHRTVIPTAVKPVWFLVPGLSLLLASPVLCLGPSVVQWNACASGCTMSQAEIQTAYEACVMGSAATIGKDAAKDESRTQAQVQAIIDDARPQIEMQCEMTMTSQCTTRCFDAWWAPEMAALGEADAE
ncbi:MAG: hypothetical protein ACJAZO_004761 [Myxococcota bacterium]|jgi:hypothetical protein